MGRILKVTLAVMISGLVIAYALSTTYIDEVYGKKIAALERDIILYDARNKQLNQQKTSLDATKLYLQAQLELEKEKVRLMKEAGTVELTQANPATTTANEVKITGAATYNPVNQTALEEQMKRLAELRQTQTPKQTTTRVTSAS